MCGIAGIIGGQTDKVNIENILGKINHRGPDGKGFYKGNNVVLGHARLSIIDLSTNANQPMIDPSTKNVIVFNGEIYNYLELKTSLENKYKFISNSDTEVILAAYSIYGIAFLEYLRGMFAFALYDKMKNKILLVRDRFGIKPLYFRNYNNSFLFASEIKAIINLDKVGENICEAKAYEFLVNRQLDCNEQTLFQSIKQLEPAHYTWINLDGKMETPKRYWDFPQLGTRPFDDFAIPELVCNFTNTVDMHLRADVPVGTFLSGGIDSSSITCFAANNKKQSELHTFSAILPYYHPENDLIKEIEKLNTKIISHKFLLSGENFFDDIPNIIFHHDEPILDGSMYAHFKLCEMAKQFGIKVLLSGSGGDELFGGYASHIYAYQAKLLSDFRILDYIKNLIELKKNTSYSYNNLLFKSIYECLPISFRRFVKNKQLRFRDSHLLVKPKIPHFYYENSDPYYSNLVNNYKSWTMPPYLHYEDRNSMAFGIETRVPFMDHKLIEFVLQFSSDDFIRGSSKSLLRKSFRGIVPDSVLQQRGKYGFPSSIDHALKNDKRGKELFYDLYKSTPLLNFKNTEKIANEFYSGKGNLTIYWRILSYIIWYNIFFREKRSNN